jgi:hypothetical protein
MSQYDAAKARFITHLATFVNTEPGKNMDVDMTSVVIWTCISTWSNFGQDMLSLHAILDAWNTLDSQHQQFLKASQRNQLDDAMEMFKALMGMPGVMNAVTALNAMVEHQRKEITDMSARCHELIELIHSSSSTIERLTVAEHVQQRMSNVPFTSDERAFVDAAHNPFIAELASASQQRNMAMAEFARIQPLGAAKLAYVESFTKFQQELARSFSFFQNQAQPLFGNVVFQTYFSEYDKARQQPEPMFAACAANYKLVNDGMEWHISGSPLDFNQWQALKLLEKPTPPPVVVASQDLQAAAQSANDAAAAANVALASASVSQSPPRDPSASGSPPAQAGSQPQTPVAAAVSGSASPSPTSTSSDLGDVALWPGSSSSSSDAPTPLAYGLGTGSGFSVSVPRTPGGSKKKTRSNHKRSTHKRSTHKHKRSTHKHKRSAHKRSAHKHKHKKL